MFILKQFFNYFPTFFAFLELPVEVIIRNDPIIQNLQVWKFSSQKCSVSFKQKCELDNTYFFRTQMSPEITDLTTR